MQRLSLISNKSETNYIDILKKLLEPHQHFSGDFDFLDREIILGEIDKLSFSHASLIENAKKLLQTTLGYNSLKREFEPFIELINLSPEQLMMLDTILLSERANSQSDLAKYNHARKAITAAVKKQIEIAKHPVHKNKSLLVYFCSRIDETLLSDSPDSTIQNQFVSELRKLAQSKPKPSEMTIHSLINYFEEYGLVEKYRDFTIDNFDDLYEALIDLKKEFIQSADNYNFFDEFNLNIIKKQAENYKLIEFNFTEDEKSLLQRSTTVKEKLLERHSPENASPVNANQKSNLSIKELQTVVKGLTFAKNIETYQKAIDDLNNVNVFERLKERQPKTEWAKIDAIKQQWQKRKIYAGLTINMIHRLMAIFDKFEEFIKMMKEDINTKNASGIINKFYSNKSDYFTKTIEQLINAASNLILIERAKLAKVMFVRIKVKHNSTKSSSASTLFKPTCSDDIVVDILEKLQPFGVKKEYVESVKRSAGKGRSLDDNTFDEFKNYILQYGGANTNSDLDNILGNEPSKTNAIKPSPPKYGSLH